MNLFISYRSLDSARVDVLVAQLRALKTAEDTPRFTVWQDKTSIPAGHDWWQAIVDAIIDCQVFVYMVSEESVQNVHCRAELSYARRRNRPIIPLVLEGEYTHNPASGKNGIHYWNHIPQELNDLRLQFLFYDPATFVQQLESALAEFDREPQRWRDIPADRPRDPRQVDAEGNNTAAMYDEACDYAWRLDFPTAERLFQQLVNLNDPDFGNDSHEWILLLREYEKLLMLDARENTRYRLAARWQDYEKQFPKPFTPLFDPKDFKQRFVPPPVPVMPESPPVHPTETNKVISLEADRLTAKDYFMRGYQHGLKGNYPAAIADYTEALKLEPKFVTAYSNRGVIRSQRGDLDGAIADFDASIRLKPDEADVWFNRGNAKYQKRNYSGAIADYTSAIRLNAEFAEAYHNRAAARDTGGDLKGAIADYEEAVRLEPNNMMMKVNLNEARRKANGK